MAKRLGIKHRKRRADKARAYAAGTAPSKHKVAKQRSRRAKLKKAHVMT